MCRVVKLTPEDDLLILLNGPTLASVSVGTSKFVLANRIAKLKKVYRDINKLADLYNGSEVLKNPYMIKKVQRACNMYFRNLHINGIGKINKL